MPKVIMKDMIDDRDFGLWKDGETIWSDRPHASLTECKH